MFRKSACICIGCSAFRCWVVCSTASLVLWLRLQLDPTLIAVMFLVTSVLSWGRVRWISLLLAVVWAVVMADRTLLFVWVTRLQSVFRRCTLNLCVWLLLRIRRAR